MEMKFGTTQASKRSNPSLTAATYEDAISLNRLHNLPHRPMRLVDRDVGFSFCAGI
jgi:hypothetical protein